MKKPSQRLLRVRVDYEPNRFSPEYLKKIYEQLTPTTSRVVKPAHSDQQDEEDATKTDERQA